MSSQPDTTSLRLSAWLLLIGQVGLVLVTQFHAGGPANDHPQIFRTYAADGSWEAVHALQFLAVAVMSAGLIVFAGALGAGGRPAIARVATSFAIISMGLYGVLQAVDGIGNKQVDLAWAKSGASDRPVRFASAESMRWLEWGLSSYYSYAIGFALLALAGTALSTAFASRTFAIVVSLAGIAYLARGWVAGSEGFTATHSALIIATWILNLIWMVWVAVVARRS